MQDPRQFVPEEVRGLKVPKKKAFRLNSSSQRRGQVQPHAEPPSKATKASKNSKNEFPAKLQQADGLEMDLLQDPFQTESEYRALRRKYLLLEEESFSLGKELSEIEAENKALEDEKFSLLDQLVVLEGLMDPSELQSRT
ncbi:unnamed protein product [Victoria cruziana]